MTAIECIDPQQVNDSDYMEYLDGERRPGFEQHLQACQYCQVEMVSFYAGRRANVIGVTPD